MLPIYSRIPSLLFVLKRDPNGRAVLDRFGSSRWRLCASYGNEVSLILVQISHWGSVGLLDHSGWSVQCDMKSKPMSTQ
jgi:hypothetical protein